MAGMGVFGLQILNGVNNSVKSMYHEHVMGVNLIKEANKYYESSQRSYNNAVRLVIIALIITIIATIVMSIILANSIVKPLHKSIDFAQSLSKGDLTKQINNKLKEIMLNIKAVSNNVDCSSDQLSTALDDSNISMDSIGYSISQIGSNIQEVTNLVENIEKRMNDIGLSTRVVSKLSDRCQPAIALEYRSITDVKYTTSDFYIISDTKFTMFKFSYFYSSVTTRI